MATYTDNIKVKISEKYKPPPRINLVTSYAQRLNLNKQVQNNIPNYDFSVEKYVIQKMKEFREKKLLALKERQSSLEAKKQKLEVEKEAVKERSSDESVSFSSNYAITSTSENLTNDISHHMQYTMPNNTMLIPTQASNCYSNILKPVQMQNYGKQIVNKEIDKKSNFKFSDFEDDTSSPFDNMELKSINDLEELAQVLNKEDNDNKAKDKVTYPQNCPTGNSHSSHLNYYDFVPSSYSGGPYLHQIPNTMSSVQPNNDNCVYSNGYKYQTDYSQFNQQYNTPYTWAKINNDYLFQSADITSKKSNCKSVPDIVNALEVELDNTNIADTSYTRSNKMKPNIENYRPKSIDDASVFHKRSQEEIDLIKSLTKDEQNICKTISVMGFPIERVARVCKLIGNDEKKVLEHLLAMSDLLDLGFQEKDVSIALLECDYDRDKALDKLIT